MASGMRETTSVMASAARPSGKWFLDAANSRVVCGHAVFAADDEPWQRRAQALQCCR